jgi:hypothetical protein
MFSQFAIEVILLSCLEFSILSSKSFLLFSKFLLSNIGILDSEFKFSLGLLNLSLGDLHIADHIQIEVSSVDLGTFVDEGVAMSGTSIRIFIQAPSSAVGLLVTDVFALTTLLSTLVGTVLGLVFISAGTLRLVVWENVTVSS